MPRRKVWRARIFSARGKPKLNGRCTFITRVYTLIRSHPHVSSHSRLFLLSSPPPAPSSVISPTHFYSALEKRERERAFLVHISRARYGGKFYSFFFSPFLSLDTCLKLELVSPFGEFRAIISPNNIFARDESGHSRWRASKFLFLPPEGVPLARLRGKWINETKFYVKD